MFGIADDGVAANDFERHYGRRAEKYDNLFVTGIEKEVIMYYNSAGNYLQKLKDVVNDLNGKVCHLNSYVLDNNTPSWMIKLM